MLLSSLKQPSGASDDGSSSSIFFELGRQGLYCGKFDDVFTRPSKPTLALRIFSRVRGLLGRKQSTLAKDTNVLHRPFILSHRDQQVITKNTKILSLGQP